MKSVRLAAYGHSNTEALITYGCAPDGDAAQTGDLPSAAAWDWDLDHLVLYQDPKNPGWYMAFNTHQGTCFHLMFLG